MEIKRTAMEKTKAPRNFPHSGMVPGLSIAAMLKSMVIVTIGNIIGGALLLAWPLRKMSADE